jgi:hypothetical protein
VGAHALAVPNDSHSIAEQRTITDGRVIPVGKSFVRKPPKRVDYLLRYTRDFPLAVVEAKASYKSATDAVQQARDYAERHRSFGLGSEARTRWECRASECGRPEPQPLFPVLTS